MRRDTPQSTHHDRAGFLYSPNNNLFAAAKNCTLLMAIITAVHAGADVPSDWVRRPWLAHGCAQRGLYVHPRHNWFVSTAIGEKLMDEVLGITGEVMGGL